MGEVRQEIVAAIAAGMANPDPKVRSYWQSIPHIKEQLTLEEVLLFLTRRIKNR